MRRKEKNILSLNISEIYNYLLRGDSYCNIDIPKYIDFDKILKQVDNEYSNNQSFGDIIDKKLCRSSYNANYRLFTNKDGKYTWRPLSFIHPVLYVYLARIIRDNWNLIKSKLSEELRYIECISIPSLPNEKKRVTEATILNWWTNYEQKSLAFGTKYRYIIKTDISNCYNSIYTHTISWAIHGKEIAKANTTEKSLCGNQIDEAIRLMQSNQTNGIPQGSVIMDLIAEIVLKYADIELEKIIKEKRYECKILRYRDDYRIFTNNINDGKEIIKDLSLILQDLNMQLNSQKTIESDDIVLNSLKFEKIESLKWHFENENIEKKLLSIYLYSLENQNSGQLLNILKEFNAYLDENLHNKKVLKNVYIDPMIGIFTQLAIKNPKVYPQCIAAISYLLQRKNKKEKKLKTEEIISIFKNQPNSELIWFWFHRIIITSSNEFKTKDKVVEKLKEILNIKCEYLWDVSFVKKRNIKKILLIKNLFDYDKILILGPVIKEKEYGLFNNSYEC